MLNRMLFALTSIAVWVVALASRRVPQESSTVNCWKRHASIYRKLKVRKEGGLRGLYASCCVTCGFIPRVFVSHLGWRD